ncbi:MAG: hypothetical protein E7543_03290 [Ruminococcaceae bacterium]|nr:hypothetical protein [Oscillospiraceae bacterium]
MNGNNFESMIKKYADELIKMSRERALPDLPEEKPAETGAAEEYAAEEVGLNPFPDSEPRASVTDIPGIEKTDFYEETAEEIISEEEPEATDFATFSARVFTGNNAYPIENAKVLVVKDDTLYTYLTTDRDGTTKKIRLPALPEADSLNPESEKRSVSYTGEVYATGFTPRKGLLVSAVGGSDIVLDVQMTPISAEVK